MQKYSSTSRVEKLIKSPRRQAINKELDQHTNRIKQLMQQDYILLQEQNAQLKIKCKKVGELQEKVELVLRSNNQLFVQNQKLAKLVEQKIEECEMLKRKLESAKRASEGLNQYERKKLLLQKQRLEKQIEQIEHFKNLTIKQIKTKHIIEIQNLRKDHETGIKLYDEQLIKIKQQLDKKDIEINLLQAKLRKAQSDNQYELTQSKEEKHKIKEEVKRLETYVKLYEDLKQKNEKLSDEHEKLKEQKKKQDEINSNKLRESTQKLRQEIEQIKRESSERIQYLQQQNTSVVSKQKRTQKSCEQHSQKLQQLQKQFQQLSSEHQKSRRQCDHLRNQIKQLQIINDKQVVALQKKYDSLHMQEIGQLQVHHQDYRMFAEKQLAKLTQIIRLKEEELLYLSEEKSRMKQGFIEEGNLMKNQLVILQQEFRDGELLHADEMRKLQQEYRNNMRLLEQQLLQKMQKNQAQHQAETQKSHQQSIKRTKKLESELISLDKQKRKIMQDLHKKTTQSSAYKDIIEHQKQQIKQIIKKGDEKQKNWKKDEEVFKNTIFECKDKIKVMEQQWNKQREQWGVERGQLEKQYRDMVGEKNRVIEKLQKQNQTFKDFIGNRDKNLLQTNTRIIQLNRQIQQRDQTIDKLREQVTKMSEKSTKKLTQQKISITQHFNHQLSLLTEDHHTKLTMLQAKISQLTLIIERKDNEIEQLLRQYKKMRDQMIVLTEQEANKKEISLKFDGANADLIATKNMFDVFVKGKVLDYCSDVVRDVVEGRENVEPKSGSK